MVQRKITGEKLGDAVECLSAAPRSHQPQQGLSTWPVCPPTASGPQRGARLTQSAGRAPSSRRKGPPPLLVRERGCIISVSNKKHTRGCLGVSDTRECAYQGPRPHPEDPRRALKSLGTRNTDICQSRCSLRTGLHQTSHLSAKLSKARGGMSLQSPPVLSLIKNICSMRVAAESVLFPAQSIIYVPRINK